MKKLLKTKFQKLLNITQTLKKIDDITDEEMLGKINFSDVYNETDFDNIDLDNIKQSFIYSRTDAWYEKLEELKKYVDKNKVLPP